jgi:hypothetical protein
MPPEPEPAKPSKQTREQRLADSIAKAEADKAEFIKGAAQELGQYKDPDVQDLEGSEHEPEGDEAPEQEPAKKDKPREPEQEANTAPEPKVDDKPFTAADADKEREAIKRERIEARELRARGLREAQRNREDRARLEQIVGDYRRLQNLEAAIKNKDYATLEAAGMSFGDWQQRVVAGESNPVVDDLRKTILESQRRNEELFQQLKQEREQERQLQQDRANMAAYQAEFEKAIDSHANLKRARRAYVIRRALEFGDRLAASGQVLAPDELAAYTSQQLAEEAADLLAESQDSPAPKGPQASPPQAEPPSRGQPKPLDNAASATRATRKRPHEMSAEEWRKQAARELTRSDDDEEQD